MSTVKTADTLTVEARRRLAGEPIQAPMSWAAFVVLWAINVVTQYTCPEKTPGRRRYVSFVGVRAEVGGLLTPAAFDRGVLELTHTHHFVHARQPWRDTSLAEDEASVLVAGGSCHEVTADHWRD